MTHSGPEVSPGDGPHRRPLVVRGHLPGLWPMSGAGAWGWAGCTVSNDKTQAAGVHSEADSLQKYLVTGLSGGKARPCSPPRSLAYHLYVHLEKSSGMTQLCGLLGSWPWK